MSELGTTLASPAATEIPLKASCVEALPYLQGLRALPTLPSVLFRFLGLVADQDVTDRELAEFIWKDPALLARAISFMKSSSPDRIFPANYAQQAIASLGRDRIRHLAFTTPLLCSLEPWKPGFYTALYWERSLLCAHACEALARQLKLPFPEQYYVAGLLHDLGYLVFLHKKPDTLATVVERWAVRPADLLETESEVIGIDHCQLGLEAARQLNLDSWMLPAIAHHHSPSRDSDWFTRVTSIGSAFCNYKGIDFFASCASRRYNRECEMEEILGGLLPFLPKNATSQLLEAMENVVPVARKWVGELLEETEEGGKCGIPYSTSQAKVAVAACD